MCCLLFVAVCQQSGNQLIPGPFRDGDQLIVREELLPAFLLVLLLLAAQARRQIGSPLIRKQPRSVAPGSAMRAPSSPRPTDCLLSAGGSRA